MSYDYDLFVIGAGSGGVRASRIAAGHGARVGICEDYRVGGTCVIRGCVPKKLLVYGSKFAHEFEDAAAYGWTLPEPTHSWATLRDNVQKEVDRLNAVYLRLLEGAECRYQSALPNHPYGYACGAYLAAVRSQASSGTQQLVAAQSVRVIRDMAGRLADSVGAAHPLSLTALSALANALARAGDLGAAVKHGQEVVAGFRDLLGPDHPLALAAEANAEVSQSALSSGSRLQANLADIDFTPLPL